MNNQLHSILIGVKKYPTITKVAQACFVTQPYISRLLAQTEKHFNLKLVNRDAKPITLTYAGERMLTYLQKQDQMQQEMTEELSHLAQHEFGSVTLALNQPLSDRWLPKFLPAISAQYPQLHINIVELTTSLAEQQLPSGKIDIFIGKTIFDKRIICHELGNVKLLLLVPSTSKLYHSNQYYRKITAADIQKLNSEPFISLGGESRFQEMVDHFLRDSGVTIENRIEAPNSQITTALAASGLGCTITTGQIIEQLHLTNADKINLLEIPADLLSLNFGISYRKSNATATVIREIFRQIQQTKLF
ncbi:hypothetical protein BSQ39_02200 [Loigolactobacillus backii]|uniref:LysR family transcriptional regulator n=1 Tax=Loigolactobacillus backii TaxID=375175 RepID=UPI000C1C8D96|nr:LysR family transcriptional regulator [Loigolactobacillus backii]PIO82458.1 hypothetical protein BSQ39_02200 [Loigolactobacillus backii]